jgi:hypothetical protein
MEPVTARQEEFLRARGLWREGLNRGRAATLIRDAKARERGE